MRTGKIEEVREELKGRRPKTREALKDYIKIFFGVDVPDNVLTEGHKSPMDYIWHAFDIDFSKEKQDNGDCVVWASRGGGKTMMAAIATALDCIFKPEIQVRILSGSGFQAGRMYEYFEKFIRVNYEDMIKDVKIWPAKKTTFKNGAMVEVLVQTETSVRGQHVHKLRCDEVELFKQRVYEAAQYTTMSSKGWIAAREVISTKHKPRGLMKKLIDEANELNQPVFKWNVWDVVERCERECKGCPLEEACRGKAKRATGYYKISDVLSQLERAKERSFYLEMFCEDGSKKKWGWRTFCRSY